jgi:predicted GNAT family acetyltransferase
MSSNEHPLKVIDNAEEHRFEARLDGAIAGHVTYRMAGGVLVLLHTEVAPEFEGKGVGGQLAAGTLQQIRERGLKIRIVCPFIASYVERHPEYNDLVAN